MAIIGINYEEGSKKEGLGYESVDICYGSPRVEKVFNTGNFVKDWYDMRKFLILTVLDIEMRVSDSSSVDHFIMDGAQYDSGYLIYDEDEKKHYLMYGAKWCDEGFEFFVPKGTQPTWEELKKTCDENTENQR